MNLNLCATFVNEVTPPEAQCFFAAQAAQENVHAEVYSLFIDRLVTDDDKKQKLYNALEGMPVIKKSHILSVLTAPSRPDTARSKFLASLLADLQHPFVHSIHDTKYGGYQAVRSIVCALSGCSHSIFGRFHGCH